MINAQATDQASVMTFDDEGDLRLEVGEKTARRSFVVCSRSLARVSKPFKAMLYGNFAESKSRTKDSKWTVELPEDDPQAFITILHIIHSQFGMIPEIVTRDQLYQITILTDKYDMTEILRPWARKWLPHVHSTNLTNQGDEVLTWMAWELGDRSLFVRKVQWMLENCSLDGAYKLSSNGKPLEDNVYIASIDILGMSFFYFPLVAVRIFPSLSYRHVNVERCVLGSFSQAYRSLMTIFRANRCETGRRTYSNIVTGAEGT